MLIKLQLTLLKMKPTHKGIIVYIQELHTNQKQIWFMTNLSITIINYFKF